MIAKNPARGKRALPPDPGLAYREGEFPTWLYSAGVEGRRLGKLPTTYTHSRWGVLEAIRELARPYPLVDRWGTDDHDRFIIDSYHSCRTPAVMQRLLAIADGLRCSVQMDARRLEPWTRNLAVFTPHFDALSPSPRLLQYPAVKLAAGQLVRVDARGVLLWGREPEQMPPPADVEAVGAWLRAAGAVPSPQPYWDGEALQWFAEVALDRTVSLGAVIVAAYQADIPMVPWGRKNRADVLVGVDRRWVQREKIRPTIQRGRP